MRPGVTAYGAVNTRIDIAEALQMARNEAENFREELRIPLKGHEEMNVPHDREVNEVHKELVEGFVALMASVFESYTTLGDQRNAATGLVRLTTSQRDSTDVSYHEISGTLRRVVEVWDEKKHMPADTHLKIRDSGHHVVRWLCLRIQLCFYT